MPDTRKWYERLIIYETAWIEALQRELRVLIALYVPPLLLADTAGLLCLRQMLRILRSARRETGALDKKGRAVAQVIAAHMVWQATQGARGFDSVFASERELFAWWVEWAARTCVPSTDSRGMGTETRSDLLAARVAETMEFVLPSAETLISDVRHGLQGAGRHSTVKRDYQSDAASAVAEYYLLSDESKDGLHYIDRDGRFRISKRFVQKSQGRKKTELMGDEATYETYLEWASAKNTLEDVEDTERHEVLARAIVKIGTSVARDDLDAALLDNLVKPKIERESIAALAERLGRSERTARHRQRTLLDHIGREPGVADLDPAD